MIVLQNQKGWKIITQRAHGLLAAMIAYQYNIDLPVEVMVPVLVAIAEHDDDVTETLTNQTRILDIGCGKPTFLVSLRDTIKANLIGLDFSDEGWKNDRDSYHNIDLRTGEITDLGNEKPMDVITMWLYLLQKYFSMGFMTIIARPI
jgi:2-polyprenyl-3-methyl-5-hydroxy-6-metoxy-1,4-benzoquinol methylase